MVESTAAAALFTEEDLERSITARFEKQVALYPDRLALRSRTCSLTYAALDRWVNRIAWGVLELRGDGVEPMGILLDDRVAAITATLAASKAAKISLQLDPSLPRDRLRGLLDDAGAGLLVSAGATLPFARSLAAEAGLQVVDAGAPSARESPPGVHVSPDTPAYILYTSGSTGRPNGVVNSHRNVLWGAWQGSLQNRITAEDRALLVASPASGQAIAIFQALLNGGTILPFDIESEGLPALRDWLRDERITVYHSVPAVFRSLVDTFRDGEAFPLLRLVRLGGDTIRREDVELFQRRFRPPCLLRIGYACTETGSITCHFIDTATPIGEGPVPVGRPTKGTEVRLLDESGRDAGKNEAGEIMVRSRYLALGYWRREELTRERFLPDPAGEDRRIFRTGDLGRIRPDGLLEHLGRKDFQVKIRGFRVEAAEVEAALRKLPGVGDAVVAASQGASGEKRLVGYVVWSGPPSSWRAVRAELATKLPDHMVPQAFVALPRLPLNARGKVDLLALPPPRPEKAEKGDDFTGARDDVERQLVEIWERLLAVRPIDVRSDFFELGGDSLLAVESFAEIERVMKRYVPLSVFAEVSTIESLAQKIREAPPRWPCLVPIHPRGTRPPFFCVHTATGEVLSYRALAQRLGSDQPFYGLRCDRLEDQRPRHARLQDMARQYIEEIRTIQPAGPYRIGGHSGGALIAFEMARQLREAGEEVSSLLLMDPPCLRGPEGEPDETAGRAVGRLGKLLQWVAFYVTKLRLLDGEERAAYVREKALKLMREGLRAAAPFHEDAEDAAGAPSVRDHTEPYVLLAYPGRATIFLARWQPFRGDRLREWRRVVSGGLDVRVVPGFHSHVVQEPFVRVLAHELEECLARDAARHGAGDGLI